MNDTPRRRRRRRAGGASAVELSRSVAQTPQNFDLLWVSQQVVWHRSMSDPRPPTTNPGAAPGFF